MLFFVLCSTFSLQQSLASCSFNKHYLVLCCVAFSQASPKSTRYAYLMHIHTRNKQRCTSSICILPDLWSHCYSACREMSLFTATPRAGLSYTIQISVCLAYPDRTNSSLLGTVAWPSAQPPQAQQLFHGMNAHTLRSISSGLLPFSLYVSFMPLYSIILVCLSTVSFFFKSLSFFAVFVLPSLFASFVMICI